MNAIPVSNARPRRSPRTTSGAAPADTASLPAGTVVRVEGTGIEAGWFTGTVLVAGERCTMVKLDRATKDGYTMLALVALKRLQRQQGSQWTDVALPPLLQREPKACLEGSD